MEYIPIEMSRYALSNGWLIDEAIRENVALIMKKEPVVAWINRAVLAKLVFPDYVPD